MKCLDFFSFSEKKKKRNKIDCRLLQILLGALRVKGTVIHCSFTASFTREVSCDFQSCILENLYKATDET